MKHTIIYTFFLLILFFNNQLTLANNLVKNNEALILNAKVQNIVIGSIEELEVKNVCVTELIDQHDQILIVEDIYQCFWARKLKNAVNQNIELFEELRFQVYDEKLEASLKRKFPNHIIYIFEYE